MYASVDGTDFVINEPAPFSSKCYSHKDNGPDLRYDSAVSLSEYSIVLASGRHACGSFLKKRFFRNNKGPLLIIMSLSWRTQDTVGLSVFAKMIYVQAVNSTSYIRLHVLDMRQQIKG